MNRQGFENTSCSVLVHHSFPLYLNRPTKLAINTKHSTLDFKRLVHWWHSKYFVALGTHHSHVRTIPREREDYYMLFTCVLKVQSIFETTCISQYICIDILDTHIDSNQSLHSLEGASLPSVLSMFNIHILEVHCLCVNIWQFLILDLFPNQTSNTCKIRSSRLDRIL